MLREAQCHSRRGVRQSLILGAGEVASHRCLFGQRRRSPRRPGRVPLRRRIFARGRAPLRHRGRRLRDGGERLFVRRGTFVGRRQTSLGRGAPLSFTGAALPLAKTPLVRKRTSARRGAHGSVTARRVRLSKAFACLAATTPFGSEIPPPFFVARGSRRRRTASCSKAQASCTRAHACISPRARAPTRMKVIPRTTRPT